jgi:hypothetical protein
VQADKLLLQLPREVTSSAAELVDRLVRKITHRDQEDYDYTDGRYIFFDKSLRTHLIKGSLTTLNVVGTDEESKELRCLYRQVFGDTFEKYSEKKKADAGNRISSHITFAGKATLVLGALSLAVGAWAFPKGVGSVQVWGALSLIWGLLAIPAGIGALLRRLWGRVLCVIQSGLALATGIVVFALPGPIADFAIAVFLVYAAYAVIIFIVMVFPKVGVFAPGG